MTKPAPLNCTKEPLVREMAADPATTLKVTGNSDVAAALKG